MAKRRTTPAQLDLDDYRYRHTHGGRRAGAGRPRKRSKRRMSHLPRPALASRFPVH